LSPTFALLLLLTVAPSSNTTPAVQQSTTQCCTATIRVRVPEGTDTIYLAGNLPQLGPWRPDGLALMGGGGGRERVGQITVPRGVAFEYKFTLGSWDREALSPAGTVPPNHQLVLERDTLVIHEITGFERDSLEYIADWKGSGVQGRLVYWTDVSSAFLEPTRHVEIWLPPGYDDSPTTRYPVLYMHDGQNLFDPRIANTGVDWGVDEAVVRLVERGVIPPVIVVGAWSTAERHPEYSPWHGAPDYARFLIEELMPRVNREFRTLTGPENTAVMGSSMGGLLSFYLVTRHPDVFGACGCVSTHFPISEAVAAEVFPGFATGAGAPPDTTPYIIRDIATGLEVPPGTRYWFDHGTEGLDSAYAPTHAVVRSWLVRQGLVEGEDFAVRQYDGATHNEAAWRARLEDPLRFLFGKSAKAQVLHDSDWRDGGVCYEIFVRSFSDSDGDGVGDGRSGGALHLAHADPCIAQLSRLRRHRLLPDRSGVRHQRGLPAPDRGSAPARHSGPNRYGGQPRVEPAPVLQARAPPYRFPVPGLVPLVRYPRAAQRVGRQQLAPLAGARGVLLRLLLAHDAGPELGVGRRTRWTPTASGWTPSDT
jgi:hypothetical protein